jgi:ribosomal protein S27E
MAGVYRPRHPERTVLYRVLFHHFGRTYGYFRPIVKEVVERYLDCGNPKCGFARIRCPDCHTEQLLTFFCKRRGFCPSCHAKRLEEWGEWMWETLLLDVPHRQVVFIILKILRVFFKFKRRLLGDLCRCALRALTRYFELVTGSALMPGVIAAIQTFGDRINFHPHLHCGGRMKVIAFITDYRAVDRIIDHLKLTFVAEKPPPSYVFTEVALMAAEESGAYF